MAGDKVDTANIIIACLTVILLLLAGIQPPLPKVRHFFIIGFFHTITAIHIPVLCFSDIFDRNIRFLCNCWHYCHLYKTRSFVYTGNRHLLLKKHKTSFTFG